MSSNMHHYLEQFKNVFDGEPLYGKSLMTVVNEIHIDQAYQKTSDDARSIYEILSHILAWRELFIKQLNGDSTTRIKIDSVQDWPPQPTEHTLHHWNELIKKLAASQKELITALQKITDEQLEKEFYKAPLRNFLDGNLQHDIYHIGQVALLKNIIKAKAGKSVIPT